ncbi:MAG: 2-phosphosulfolactate phosphatase, partial [Chloroflexi bacterium]|nr:2-phosphosulfolactate phosphatase [Chloroflexota bacterium]
EGWVMVAVDVIRATTTAVTAVSLGRRCLPVATAAEAAAVAATLDHPLLAGELAGTVPAGFELDNSPADLVRRSDVDRPLVLLSSSGTRLMARPFGTPVYVACLRNESAVAACLRELGMRVALVGACSRGEFREEDQICCARIAASLIDAGFQAAGPTAALVERWRDAPLNAIRRSRSTAFLEQTGRLDDLEFVLTHVDDLDCVFVVENGELVSVPAPVLTRR